MKLDNSKTPKNAKFIPDDFLTEIPKPTPYIKPDQLDEEQFREIVKNLVRWREFYDLGNYKLE